MRFFSLLFLLFPVTLSAQLNVTQVMDINAGATGSRTSASGVAFKGLLYFPATAADSGTELWVSDGTDAGTFLLTDLVPGPGSSNPADLIVVDDQLYFTAEAAATGRELYLTDGTAAGTVLVSDIQPGTGSGIPGETSRAFASFDGRLYFAAADSGNNVELWSAVGTNAFLIRDFQSGSQGSYPENFVVANDLLYFAADNGTNGNELWQTNGNPAATFRLTDTNPGGSDGDPKGMTEAGGKLFFLASNGFAAGDLYAYNLDGTGVQRVFDFAGRGTQLSTNTSRSPIARLGDQVVFAAENGNGADLWISDGTEAGTRVLLDNPEVPFGGYTPQELVSVGNYVFYKDETEAEGIELWRTDGTTEGTIMVKDLDEGFSASIFLPTYFHAHNGNLFFGANGDVVDGFGSTGIEPYISDGTGEGTFLVMDINDGFSDADPNNFVSIDDQLFFFADNGTDGQELHVVSTAPAITPLMANNIFRYWVRCNGENNGSIELTVSGGVPPYQIEDQTSENGEFVIRNLSAGDYTLVITDAQDSTLTVSASVSEPSRLRIVLNRLSGQNSLEGGLIDFIPSGGIPPYSFAWADTSLTSNIREDLDFGTYYVTVTDDNNCMVQDSFIVDDLTPVTNLSEGEFSVYPTLVSGQLTIETSGNIGIRHLSIFDLTGRNISTMTASGQHNLTLSASFLPKAKGIYLVKIEATDGRRGIRRVVIQ